MFDRIPAEMRGFAQWVVWRYEDTDGPKPTKVPYGPLTQQLANVNDPSTWSTFDAAVAAVQYGGYSGIGFVLTDADPYAFIDLDDTAGDPAKAERQQKIYEAFNSYSERSPSGKGLHVIVKGKLANGRRRSAIEVYSSQRYMTMTGNVYNDAPIVERQDLLEVLWNEMGGNHAAIVYDGNAPELYSDNDVIERALKAVNGDKFAALLRGEWANYYPSQSEADFAFIDIIAFYTQNREQITRLFHGSPLGQRAKAKRADYVAYMVNKSFDRMLPPVDIDGLRNALEEAKAKSRAAPMMRPASAEFNVPLPHVVTHATTAMDLPSFDFTIPPGLLGEVAQFIHAASPRPVPEIALAGAIGFLAGICGRAFNISGTGLNQYVLLLAPTGTGKEAMASGIDKLMDAVKRTVPAVIDFSGPAEIRSDAALLKYLSKNSSCFVSIVGEFGIMLQNMAAKTASSHLSGLQRVMLDVYNKSGEGQTLRPTIYSDREKNTDMLLAPSFTLLGESTPEAFYEALDESLIARGLLPRFLMIEYHGLRPALNPGHVNVKPPQQLVDQLAALCGTALMLMNSNTANRVKTSPDAQTIFAQLDAYCDTQINASKSEVMRHLWNRAHIKALKLAALIAVGVNPYEPVITIDIANWAIALVCHDVRNLLAKFASGAIGVETAEVKQINEIIRVVREFVTKDYSEMSKYCDNPRLHNDHVIPYSYISRRLTATAAFRLDRIGAAGSIQRAIKQLIESGDMREIGRQDMALKYNSTARGFMIVNPRTFGL